MSQWNALNVNVIKTKKIECAKLNLPSALTRSPDKKSSPSLKSASTKTENLNSGSQDCKQLISKNHSSGETSLSLSHFSTEDNLSSSVAEDEVFQESFETPPEENSSFSKSSTKRCLSLPTYLSSDHFYSIQPDVSFRPRRLFEEALNLESYSEGPQSNRLNSRVETDQGPGNHIFPREQEKTRNSIHKRNQSRTTHAARMKRVQASSPIICDDNNNIDYDRDNLESTIQSKSSFNVRDWEQKVLVLTSDYEFGTEFSKKPRDECDRRSRSVALTGNISTIGNDKSAKDQNQSKRQVKSETKSEMPKLQTVVWDYIKRKSTKRKRKNQTSHSEKQENLKSENQGSSSENVENSTCNDLASDPKSFDASLAAGKTSSNGPGILSDISRSSRPMKSWKSTPNLHSTCDSEISENIALRRYNSFNHLSPPHKSPPKLPAKELEINSRSLTFLLTTASEEKPMDERMQTLKLSREWLLKELKSMREEDRRLARQFIHLRSAIVEMREFCEKEELDYDSGPEQKTIDQGTLHKDNKRSQLIERKIPIHNTPTRNIIGYC